MRIDFKSKIRKLKSKIVISQETLSLDLIYLASAMGGSEEER
jgi:hypothetical protein